MWKEAKWTFYFSDFFSIRGLQPYLAIVSKAGSEKKIALVIVQVEIKIGEQIHLNKGEGNHTFPVLEKKEQKLKSNKSFQFRYINILGENIVALNTKK